MIGFASPAMLIVSGHELHVCYVGQGNLLQGLCPFQNDVEVGSQVLRLKSA